jgi:hypothetical protein
LREAWAARKTTYDPLAWLHADAYRLANYLISKRDKLVEGLVDEDRRQLTDALQDIDRDFPNRCRCGTCGLKW